jgi:hypothetical protein
MTFRTTLPAIVCGFIAGLLGFIFASHIPFDVATVRSRSFELVNNQGRIAGAWSVDNAGSVRLTMFDDTGGTAIELSENRRQESLIFNGTDRRMRVDLIATDTGSSSLNLGDTHRQSRLAIGSLDESDVPSDAPPDTWGVVIHGPTGSHDYFTAAVRGEYQSGTEKTFLRILRPNGKYWVVP